MIDKPSVMLFGLHRGGSSIVARLLDLVLGGAGYTPIDEAKRYYEAGYSLDEIPRSFYESIVPHQNFYGPFREYSMMMRLAYLAQFTKIVVVRDPRDCLVSSYFSLRGGHDKLSARRATQLLPTPLEEEETIDDFCIRSAVTFRGYIDSLRLLCLDHPDTLLFRYEDIFRDAPGWLDVVISRLALDVPPESLDQARIEAVFETTHEDPSRHHRQGRPGDYRNKLLRSTNIYLTGVFEQQLCFFSYGNQLCDIHGTARSVPLGVPPVGPHDDIAALKRIIGELQRENGFRIDEIASLRAEIASKNGGEGLPC